jgi:ketosteroid isomerase-like protein
MRIMSPAGLGLAAVLAAPPAQGQTRDELVQQVREAELAFASTMARRDHAAFGSFVAEEALFFANRQGVLRGRTAVLEAWKPLFWAAEAPFSWEPETVQVLDSGTLAFSSGPIRDPRGNRVGTFNAVWRREADGRWLVVFEKGCPACDCGGTPQTPRR